MYGNAAAVGNNKSVKRARKNVSVCNVRRHEARKEVWKNVRVRAVQILLSAIFVLVHCISLGAYASGFDGRSVCNSLEDLFDGNEQKRRNENKG